jgi:23S rRNA (uracil1939-C5)-methyltransferase
MSDAAGSAADLTTLVIESIAAGGDGVGRSDGLVVFVPRTAPGDRVTARVKRERRLARGRVERLEVASPERTDPECRHYAIDRCGGCQLQHITLPAQQEAKRQIIRDTLRRIGRRTVDLPSIVAGPTPWRYRQRLSLALRRRADRSWFAGMHAWDDVTHVFDLSDCLITDERVIALWREVLAAADGLPDVEQLRGTVRRVGDRGAIVIEGGTTWPGADAFVARLKSFDHAWWIPEGGRRRRIGAAAGGGGATRPHASFSQVNPGVASLMGAFVEERVLAHSPTHVLDAYAGSGDLAASLDTQGIRATAVELDEDATAFSAARLKRPSRAVAAKVEDVIGGLLPADVIVLNPPRAGVDERVAKAIEGADPAPGAVIYVSCDPATLARDLARMPSWSIAGVTAFDMFPQTAHVETVVELVRSKAP